MNFKEQFQYLIEDPNILNIYIFGSHLYKCNNENSDIDLICVTKDVVISDDINIHFYTLEQFKGLLDNHEIQMLECVFSPDEFILKKSIEIVQSDFNKTLLRKSISTITSNSWVKGKKKLIIQGDYDKWTAIKSVFHSIRILDFGIQICEQGKISNFSSMNWLLTDLIKLSNELDFIDLWNAIDTKYRKLFNNLSSRFKSFCPKDENIKGLDFNTDITTIFKKHNIKDNSLKHDLLILFNSYLNGN